MSDFKGGGKAYPGKPEFVGDNGSMQKVGDGPCAGSGVNVPDHVDKKATVLDMPSGA